MNKGIFLVFITLLSCGKKLQMNEVNSFCYDFIYSIHTKDQDMLDSLIDKEKLVESINNKFENKKISYEGVIAGLFLGYNPLKYGYAYKDRLNNFNENDLEITILESKGSTRKINIKWNNIFNIKKRESITITLENRKIVFL